MLQVILEKKKDMTSSYTIKEIMLITQLNAENIRKKIAPYVEGMINIHNKQFE